MSLRTTSDFVNLSSICTLFGGGGHDRASAFEQDKNFFNINSGKPFDFRKFMTTNSHKINY